LARALVSGESLFRPAKMCPRSRRSMADGTKWARLACRTTPRLASSTSSVGCMVSPTSTSRAVRCFRAVDSRIPRSPSSRLRFVSPIISGFAWPLRRLRWLLPCLALSAAGAQTDTTRHHVNVLVFLAGGVTSLALHETGHIVASYAVGAHPSFGFNKGRPTIYSGIDADLNPGKQFVFSSAGLTVQTLLDEAIIDIPHSRGGTFERGILFGGLVTTAFYITLGRSGSVSDVAYMA